MPTIANPPPIAVSSPPGASSASPKGTPTSARAVPPAIRAHQLSPSASGSGAAGAVRIVQITSKATPATPPATPSSWIRARAAPMPPITSRAWSWVFLMGPEGVPPRQTLDVQRDVAGFALVLDLELEGAVLVDGLIDQEEDDCSLRRTVGRGGIGLRDVLPAAQLGSERGRERGVARDSLVGGTRRVHDARLLLGWKRHGVVTGVVDGQEDTQICLAGRGRKLLSGEVLAVVRLGRVEETGLRDVDLEVADLDRDALVRLLAEVVAAPRDPKQGEDQREGDSQGSLVAAAHEGAQSIRRSPEPVPTRDRLGRHARHAVRARDLGPGRALPGLDQLAKAPHRPAPAALPPPLAPDLPEAGEGPGGKRPEGERDPRGRALLQFPDDPDREAVEPTAAAVLHDPVRPVHLGDHRLHIADPRRRVDAKAGRRAAPDRRDPLEPVVAREMVHPRRADSQVADEVEDALTRGVD